jgi:hypothetical protein
MDSVAGMTKVTVVGVDVVFERLDAINSNNHRDVGDLRRVGELPITPEAYEREMRQTAFEVWASLIAVRFETVELGEADCALLLRAGRSGTMTGRLPNQHRDELDELAGRLQATCPALLDGACFARMARCSLKDGCVGAGPFRSGADLVRGLVTSPRCWDALSRECLDAPVKLYLLPWRDDVNTGSEFRVFVHDECVTAITQYDAYRDHGWARHVLTGLVRDARELARVLLDQDRRRSHCDASEASEASEAVRLPRSFTMDVFRNAVGGLELVELNSFGAQMAAGSGLFHWITDYGRLHGRMLPEVEVRVVGAASV